MRVFHCQILLVIICALVENVKCARILGIIPIACYSHQNFYRIMWQELSKRGHELVILTTDPMRDPSLRNLQEIDLHGAYKYNTKIVKLLKENSKTDILKATMEIEEISYQIVNYELQQPEVQTLINNVTEHFDLVIVEYHLIGMFAFAARFNCPFIGVMSIDFHTFGHIFMGNPVHPILYPEVTLPFVKPHNLYERTASVFAYFIQRLYAVYIFRRHDNLAKKFFGQSIPDLDVIAKNISLIFFNSNPALSLHRPLSPATIEIGGGFHLRPSKNLTGGLKQFLDSGTDGVIYFSLGSNVKSVNNVSEKQVEVFVKSFQNMRYKVLWVLDGEIADLPTNVKVVKWVSQQDILGHPNVKLFITQGGLQSLEESILNCVPMVVIPLFYDQHRNAEMIVQKKVGLTLDIDNLNQNDFVETVEEVITNKLYLSHVTKLADLILDQPMTGLQKAVWWIEFTIRHKGNFNLKADTIPLYQYYFLDITAVIILLIFLFYKIVNMLLGVCIKRKIKIKSN